ncbi:Uncharacterized protein PBTT_05803 [Plasmodiophora brassicae]|uniref:Uncharacterized protein n=1 Tax=Plasmodiophora brassicae TaxID=37360 RepID=A0A0G4J346_PLABS|nr:hypothetical protein PBRA_002338 [Plasmodiophora brassicae]
MAGAPTKMSGASEQVVEDPVRQTRVYPPIPSLNQEPRTFEQSARPGTPVKYPQRSVRKTAIMADAGSGDGARSDSTVSGEAPVTHGGGQRSDDVKPDQTAVKKRKRVFVDERMMNVLMSSYDKHYAEYAKGKGSVSQVLPFKVWQKVYADFKLAFPGCPVSEEQLKQRIRDRRHSPESPSDNDGVSKPPDRRRSTWYYLTREEAEIMDAAMADVIHEPAPVADEAAKDGMSAVPPMAESTVAMIPAAPKEQPDEVAHKPASVDTKPITGSGDLPASPAPAQMLERQTASIAKISANLEASAICRQRLLQAKTAKALVENLKEALNLDLISKEEFDRRARELLLGDSP